MLVAIVCVYLRLSRGKPGPCFVTIRDIWFRGFGPIFDASTFVFGWSDLNMRRPLYLVAAAFGVAAPVVLWSAQAGSRATADVSARQSPATERASSSTASLEAVLKQYCVSC